MNLAQFSRNYTGHAMCAIMWVTAYPFTRHASRGWPANGGRTEPSVRLFVALDVPDAWRESAREALDALPAPVQALLRPERPERLHVTLRFIGEYPEAALPPLRQALDAHVGGVDLVMELRAAGAFGGSVLWLGVESEGFTGLVGRVEQAMAAAGVSPRGEAFSGHMTIARTRRRLDALQRAALASALGTLPAPPRSPVRVSSVVLFESAQERGTSIYRALHRTDG